MLSQSYRSATWNCFVPIQPGQPTAGKPHRWSRQCRRHSRTIQTFGPNGRRPGRWWQQNFARDFKRRRSARRGKHYLYVNFDSLCQNYFFGGNLVSNIISQNMKMIICIYMYIIGRCCQSAFQVVTVTQINVIFNLKM